MSKTEIITKDETLPATQADQTFALLQQAVQQGADPENLGKLLDLQDRVQAREAQAQLNNALAEFQAKCPAIIKSKEVRQSNGRLMYRYAPMEDIVHQVRPLLAELGLSFSFDTGHAESGVDVWCAIHHRGGGSTRSHVFIPSTKGHNTNAAQEAGLQVTYGKRAAFTNALGITTADEDLDGASADLAPITAAQVKHLNEMIDSVGADRVKFLKYLGVDGLDVLPAIQLDKAMTALLAKGKQQ